MSSSATPSEMAAVARPWRMSVVCRLMSSLTTRTPTQRVAFTSNWCRLV